MVDEEASVLQRHRMEEDTAPLLIDAFGALSVDHRTAPRSIAIPETAREALADAGFSMTAKIQHITSLGPYFYPSFPTMSFPYLFMVWFFEIDDKVDEGRERNASSYVARLCDVAKGLLEPQSKFERITLAIRNEAHRLCGTRTNLFQRLIAEMCGWLNSIAPFQDSTSLSAYQHIRLVNVGVAPTLTAGEILHGLDLSAACVANSYFQLLRAKTAWQVALVNDIVSVHQDRAQGRRSNYLLLSGHESLEQAQAAAFEQATLMEVEIARIAELFINTTESLPDTRADKEEFVQICWNVVGGHVEWVEKATGRYAKGSHSVFDAIA
ncbi:MAG: terpene synthase family protein [Nannocystaceae bacterium]